MSGADRFIAHARGMIGVRWRHQGRKPWAVDCVGLVVVSLDAAGWPRVEVGAAYGREPWDDRLRRTLRDHFGEPVEGAWLPGDIALVRWFDGEPTHVGILANHPNAGLSIIHATNLRGVVETSLAGRIADAVIEVYRPAWPEPKWGWTIGAGINSGDPHDAGGVTDPARLPRLVEPDA